MDKHFAGMQGDVPHRGTHLLDGNPTQYPPAAVQDPPGPIGYPRMQADYHGSQAGYYGHQGANSGPQDAFSGPPAGCNPAGLPFQSQSGNSQPAGLASAPWMPAPPLPLNCPPGLEYLTQIDQILVHQQVELVEVLIGFETNNKYEIKNSLGQRVYFAVEDTDCCTRNCCGPYRPFTVRVLDNLGREVMTLERPLRCSSCCFPCCLQEIEIQAPPGVPVGYVTQTWHPCLPKFTLQNEKREDVLKVGGPCVVCSCCSDVDFKIKSLNEESVIGKITKNWSGCVREAFTDADNFGIQFPLDLDMKMKAVVLGAYFLIEYMFFEDCN